MLLYPLRARLHERGEEGDVPVLVTNLAWLECLAGNLSTARALASEAIEAALLTESESMAALSFSVAALVEAHAGQERICRDQLEEALKYSSRTGYGLAVLWTASTAGFLELSLGDAAAAYRALGPATEFVENHGLKEPVRAFFLPDAIEALVALGEIDRAERLTAMLETCGRRFARPWALATSARGRALVATARGNPGAAEESIEHALAEHQRLEMPLELGRTLLAKGQIERRLRQKAAARRSLEQCRAIFDQVGAALWTERSLKELERIGLRPTRHSDELTESEQRVADLVASGLRNREVAARLFMSPKTVEAHLACVYRKLGIGSRAELGARLAGAGREPPQT